MLSNSFVSRREIMVLLLLGLLCSTGQTRICGAEPADLELLRERIRFFEKRIRPVLVDKCFPCHSAVAGKFEGSVRLDSLSGLKRGGTNGPAIVPFDPKASRLLEVVRRIDPKTQMVPKHLLAASVGLDIEAWIRMGAPAPGDEGRPSNTTPPRANDHWAFQSLTQPVLPPVRSAAWVKDPIDQFILAGLESHGIQPVARADRATWLRRVTFDLTGLPPNRKDLETFLADNSDGAIAKVIDQLLRSPHFGENWGRHWLQLIGYADGTGAELSEQAWRYRDYVIASWNSDKPYDVFIREQLAGDLLSDSNDALAREHQVATGFLVLATNPVFEPHPSKLDMDSADDQIEAVGRSFLGLSVGCARCHDHKTDPISMRDYYGLAGIFTSTASWEGGADDIRRPVPRWRERSLATSEQRKEYGQYQEHLRHLKERVQAAREMKAEFPGEIDSTRLSGIVVDNLAAEIQGNWKESSYSTNFVDRNYLHDGNADKGKKTARFVPDLPSEGLYTVLVSYTPRGNRATYVPVTVQSKLGAKTIYVDQTREPTVDKVFAPVGQFTFESGTNGSVVISNQGTKGFVVVDAVRFVPVAGSEGGASPSVQAPDPELALLNYRQLEKEFRDLQSSPPLLPKALAVEEGIIRNTRLRIRGESETLGEEVPRGFPSWFKMPDSTAFAITDETSGRLELANWITGPASPLTARVVVNRIWQHLFGRGLVESVNDFGISGSPPSHSELLDHLAGRFIQQGWSVKKLIRAIVLSNAYQMSSSSTSASAQADPDNILVHCMNRRAIEAGELRDAVLSVAGQLDATVGGSWMAADANDSSIMAARTTQAISKRRTVYLPLWRDPTGAVLPPFPDATEKGPTPGAAGVIEGPAEAVLPARFLRDQTSAWARRLASGLSLSGSNRVELAFEEALARAPTENELQATLKLLGRAAAQGHSESAVPEQWEALCRSLLLSDSFRFVD